MRESDPARGTAALQKGVGVLEVLAELGGAGTFSEIVRLSGLPKGTAHRILAALLERGLLRLDEHDDRYRFGAKLFEFARFARADFDLPALIEPELVRLHMLTGETICGALPHGLDAVSAKVLGGAGASAFATEGSVVPGHATAAGKVILAFSETRQREAMLTRAHLAAYTPRTLTDAAILNQQLDVAKARRYAIEDEEFRPGQRSVAAPILDRAGRAVGALAIVGPAFRLTTGRLHELGADLLKAAARVTGQSAFSHNEARRHIMTTTGAARPVVETSAFLGEGPVWLAAEKRLAWIDILRPALHISDPADGSDRMFDLPEIVGACAPAASGGFVLGAQSGFAHFDPQTRALTRLVDPEADKPNNRFNDGKCDPRGRFWAGTMDMAVAPGAGSLYRLDPDFSVHRMETGLGISNGLGWSPDGRRMYFTDSLARTIFVYDFDVETGAIGNRRVFAQTPDHMGVPDGLAVDAEGCVWSAQWDGWQVVRFDPDGRIEQSIALPVPRPTSCAFGGPDLKTLFVTSARIRLSAQQLSEAPLSGSVLAMQAPAAGLVDHAFSGDPQTWAAARRRATA
jgi:sugar lactone lactonase YvrE/DNA-binding IclR family transcriptional regulator